MRDLMLLQQYRNAEWEMRAFGRVGDSLGGCFLVPYAGAQLACIAGNGDGWDHVSVSVKGRTPKWAEMAHVYGLFAEPHETWMQLHVPATRHVNCHPYCLHIWRPHDTEISVPPLVML